MKNILITGCSSGIGLALTNYFLSKSFRVIGVSRSLPSLISHHSSLFTHIECDFSKPYHIERLLNSDSTSSLDILKSLATCSAVKPIPQ